MKRYDTKFFSPQSLREKLRWLPEEVTLSILSWLCQEISTLKGFPSHLDPENRGKIGEMHLDLQGDYYNTWMRDTIQYALQDLPLVKVGHQNILQSAAAMRKILKKWGKKTKAFKVINPSLESSPTYLGIEHLLLFKEADLTVSLNTSHPKATRINWIIPALTKKGKASITLNIKHARNGSSWTYEDGEPSYPEENYEVQAAFLTALAPLPDEIPAETFTRIQKILAENTPEGPIPTAWDQRHKYWQARRQRIEIEKVYEKLEKTYSPIGFSGGNLTPDEETKAQFGEDEHPYFIYEEIHSMLADYLCSPQEYTKTEANCLAQGLRKMRKLGKIARPLAQIQMELKNSEPNKALQKLKKTLAQARKEKLQVSIRVPKGKEEGLTIVPIQNTSLNYKRKTFSIKGQKNSTQPLKEIREFLVE